ncbi:MAG: hypothetical protein JG764_2235 [Clostridiales bacterium]|nr:hypothetical protein [Clostridiales bacterium]
MKVKVELKQSLRSIHEKRGSEKDLNNVLLINGRSLAELYAVLGLKNYDVGFATVNGQLVHNDSYQLKDGDNVVLYPPLAGG